MNGRVRRWVALLSFLLSACGGGDALAPVLDGGDLSARQPMGEVQAGDTLYAFAWRYGADYREIAQWNGLEAPYRIQAGERLRLSPGGQVVRRAAVAAPVESGQVSAASPPQPAPTPAAPAPTPPKPPTKAAPEPASGSASVAAKSPKPASPTRSSRGWYWPAEGKVSRRFNPAQPGGQGIRIATKEDAQVVASRDGRVVYLGGGLPGYGRLIIVKHTEDLLTAYGYLGHAFVSEGDQVRGGQVIAVVATGRNKDAPQLHFEIRRQGKPTDPLAFISG